MSSDKSLDLAKPLSSYFFLIYESLTALCSSVGRLVDIFRLVDSKLYSTKFWFMLSATIRKKWSLLFYSPFSTQYFIFPAAADAITVTWVKNFTNNVLSDHLFGGGQPVLLVLATFLVYTKKRKENNYKTFLHVELSKKKGRIG